MTRSAINGDIMILDHKDIDIVLKQKDRQRSLRLQKKQYQTIPMAQKQDFWSL